MNDGMTDICNIKPERVSFLQLADEETKPQKGNDFVHCVGGSVETTI